MKNQTNNNDKLKLLLLRQQQYIKNLEKQLRREREKVAELEAKIDYIKYKGE